MSDRTCQSGVRSVLVLLTFWPNGSLRWGCLSHWKVLSNRPGLCSLEANAGDGRQTHNTQINKVTGENETCLLFHGKNVMAFWAHPVLKPKQVTRRGASKGGGGARLSAEAWSAHAHAGRADVGAR